MAVTKTDFINFTRCRRYAALENIRKDKLMSNMTVEEYVEKEKEYEKEDLLKEIFELSSDGEEIDTTVKVDKQLEALMEYYKRVELLAGEHAQKLFGGKSVYSVDTYNQESFDFDKNGIKYLCFVDIYNEQENEINIIEVKATTSRKYKVLEYIEDKIHYPMFEKINNIYHLTSSDSKSYQDKINKLTNRYTDEGKYIYDLAVQRYIIDNYFQGRKKVNYYLAVLNNEYTYDGYEENGESIYRKDEFGNEIIDIFDMNTLTEKMLGDIEKERINLERYIFGSDESPCRVGLGCALKKRNECKFTKICFANVPKKNASYNYKRFVGFKYNGITYNKYDLINEGYLKLDDVPYEWLTSENHKIQRNCYDSNETYINKEKIKAGLDSLTYPIYHLDFESLPCPLPRFKGEKPYYQSCFEFSLHIERKPGVCDKIKDNFVFLATSNKDERLELVKALVENIPIQKTGGCMLAQNVGFEKERLKELAECFPEYKTELLAIREAGRDLLEIIENNKSLYESLGFDEYDASTVNYYNNNQSGSYSIKKTLPLFTNLSYSDLEVQNGVDALVEYTKFDSMTKTELDKTRNNLIEYCRQDTWAMVEILRGLRKLV